MVSGLSSFLDSHKLDSHKLNFFFLNRREEVLLVEVVIITHALSVSTKRQSKKESIREILKMGLMFIKPSLFDIVFPCSLMVFFLNFF